MAKASKLDDLPRVPGRRLPDLRHERFCREYVATQNGSLAARRAGYSVNSAAQQASDLLRVPYIAKRIQVLTEEQLARIESDFMSREEVLARIARIARADRRALVDEDGNAKALHELDDETAAAVEAYEDEDETPTRGRRRKIKMASQLQALRMLGEATNAFAQHQESGAAKVTVNITGKDAEA